jgi:N-hydroxyarylamine O-acetyltransferase
MAEPFALDAYLARIGHTGPRTPTLATLAAILAAHAEAIPYENIEVLLGAAPALDSDALQRKLVQSGRGGYCFEQNLLLRGALAALGFATTNLLARVVRGFPPDAPRNAGHMALRVSLPEGEFLADVGFGNLTPTAPLAITPHAEQPTPFETMRLLPVGGELVLQARLGESWENLYRICDQTCLDADYEVANWYVATRPQSLFSENLIAARPRRDGLRHTFLNGRLSTRAADGTVTRRVIEDDAGIAGALADVFGLRLPPATAAAALAAITAKGRRGAEHAFFA